MQLNDIVKKSREAHNTKDNQRSLPSFQQSKSKNRTVTKSRKGEAKIGLTSVHSLLNNVKSALHFS